MMSQSSFSAEILVLGAAVDRNTLQLLTQVDRIPQVQTYRFQWALIRAIESGLGREIDVISTVPTRDFPYTRKIYFWPRRQLRGTAVFRQMPMINLLGIKQISRLLTSGFCIFQWLAGRQGQKMIVSYGVIVPHLIPAAILGRFFGAKLVGVVTDAPLTYHDEGLVYRSARWFDRKLLAWCMTKLDGIIALTRPLAERFAPGAPSLIMEGIISDDVEQYAHKDVARDESVFTIMYAGQLHADYGVKALLDAFLLCLDPSFRLLLYGQGTLEDEIRSAAARDPRISYQGFQPAEVIFPAMLRADVMVVPRFQADRMAEYSFPSKLLEYLAMGRIVISAALPSIPVEYFDHLVLVDKIDAPTLASKLREVAGWSSEIRRRREKAAREFVFSNKTQVHQGRRIVQFLQSICAKE